MQGVTTDSKLIHGALFIRRQLGMGHLMSGPAPTLIYTGTVLTRRNFFCTMTNKCTII
jgi:hypothetical protein